jgi:hypothetical protein
MLIKHRFESIEGGIKFMKENNKTSLRGITRIAIFVCGVLFLVSMVLPAGVVQALQGFEDGSAIPEHYPNKFEQIGRVDRIELDEVVINDCLFKFSPDVEYHTPSVENASSAWFKVGQFVGYITNSKREIVSLWLIE